MNRIKNSITKKRRVPSVVKIIIGLFFILMAYWIIGTEPEPAEKISGNNNPVLARSGKDRSLFYQEKIAPELDRFNKANMDAANSAIWKIMASFDEYGNHVDEFVEDMSSLSSDAAMAWNGAKDFTNRLVHHDKKAEAFRIYTQKKFEKHFFSQKQLKAMLENTVAQYADNVRANQNRLHMRVEKAWEEAEMPGKFNWAPVMADINSRIMVKTSKIGRKSIESMALATVGGFIVGEGVPHLVSYIFGKMAASFAVAAGETTGGTLIATESGAATGGIFGGPPGAIIGGICGFVGACIAEHYTAKYFRKKMSERCRIFLAEVQNDIINGRPGHPGFLSAMQNAAKTIFIAERMAVKKSIIHG